MNVSSSVVMSSTATRRLDSLDSLDSIDSNTSPKKKWDVAKDSFKVNKLRVEAKEELVRQQHHKEQQKTSTMKKPKFDLDYGGILTSMKNKHDAAQAKSPTKTSDAKSYLKSRREKARRERHGNMLSLIDQNIERLSPVKTSLATTTTLNTKKVNIDIPRLSPDTKKKKKKKKIKKTTKDKEEGKVKKPKRKSSFSLLAPSLGSSSSPTTLTTAADSSSTSTHGSRLRNVLNPFRSHSRGKSGDDKNKNDNSNNSGRSNGSRSLSLTSTGKSSRNINKSSASAANTSDKASTPSTKERSDSPSRSLASDRLFRSPSSVKQRRRGRRSSSKVSNDSEKDAEMKAIVDKVLRNYPKERCKTLEDHRQYAFAELLTAQSNSSYSSSNSNNDMMSSAENIQDLKAMLDSHLASSVKSTSKSNKSNDNNGGDATFNDTYDRSPRNDRSNSPTKNKKATESILRVGGKATTSSPRASKKPSIHSPKRNQHVFVDSKLKKTVSLSPRKVADEEPVAKSPRVPLSRHLSAPPTPTSKRSKSGEKMFNDSNTTCLTETSMTDFDGSASEVKLKLLIPVVKLLTTDKNGRIGKYTGTIDADTGKPHGTNGRLEYEDGGSYEGDWSSGSYSGYGTHVNWNGDVYEGNFLENSKHGTGCYRYHDGRRKFEGRYDTGERVEGRMLYGDGSVYDGQWKGGKRQGRGTYTFRDGSVYKGEFFDDVIHGVGRIVWPDGSKYIGDWKQGHRHGLGKEYTPAGRLSYEGRWKESSPVA